MKTNRERYWFGIPKQYAGILRMRVCTRERDRAIQISRSPLTLVSPERVSSDCPACPFPDRTPSSPTPITGKHQKNIRFGLILRHFRIIVLHDLYSTRLNNPLVTGRPTALPGEMESDDQYPQAGSRPLGIRRSSPRRFQAHLESILHARPGADFPALRVQPLQEGRGGDPEKPSFARRN